MGRKYNEGKSGVRDLLERERERGRKVREKRDGRKREEEKLEINYEITKFSKPKGVHFLSFSLSLLSFFLVRFHPFSHSPFFLFSFFLSFSHSLFLPLFIFSPSFSLKCVFSPWCSLSFTLSHQIFIPPLFCSIKSCAWKENQKSRISIPNLW